MRFRNPHLPGSLLYRAWEDIRNHARLVAEFPAGSPSSKYTALLEALIAGCVEGQKAVRYGDIHDAFIRAFNTVSSSLRKEDDVTGHSNSAWNYVAVPPWALVLNVFPPFSLEKLKRRYRALCRIHHPDIAGGQSEERMKQIILAYEQALKEVLS